MKGWSWSYGSWIYNYMYLCNQYLSPLTWWVWIPLRQGVLHTTLCDKVCQWLETVLWFSMGTLVSSTNETDCHDITEILLNVALNTITLTLYLNEKNCIESEYYVNICKLFLVLKQKIEKLEVQKIYIYINDYIYKVKIYTSGFIVTWTRYK